MSVQNEQTENMKKEVVVQGNEHSADLVVEVETKKTKAIRVAKKVGKVAAVVGVGLLGFLLGTKAGKKSEYNDSDIIDVEYEEVNTDNE